jgi:protein-S-isoprenylcysteine O-methyltransferase Ste14
MILFALGHLLYAERVNPGILRHRMGLKKGTEAWDWAWFAIFVPTFYAIFFVAHADLEVGGSSLPQWVRLVGLALFVFGGGLFLRAMGESPFFEKTVRIQSERDHRVVDTGPYRVVRHPGYAGMLPWVVSIPLLLTSSLAMLPAVLSCVTLLVRTALEDRTLQKKLSGYSEYAERVRWRLLPGVW